MEVPVRIRNRFYRSGHFDLRRKVLLKNFLSDRSRFQGKDVLAQQDRIIEDIEYEEDEGSNSIEDESSGILNAAFVSDEQTDDASENKMESGVVQKETSQNCYDIVFMPHSFSHRMKRSLLRSHKKHRGGDAHLALKPSLPVALKENDNPKVDSLSSTLDPLTAAPKKKAKMIRTPFYPRQDENLNKHGRKHKSKNRKRMWGHAKPLGRRLNFHYLQDEVEETTSELYTSEKPSSKDCKHSCKRKGFRFIAKTMKKICHSVPSQKISELVPFPRKENIYWLRSSMWKPDSEYNVLQSLEGQSPNFI